MEFLGHLAIIAGALFGLVVLIAAPRGTVFFAITLGCGYIGSDAGIVGTLIGLVVGAVAGGIVYGLMSLVFSLFRPTAPAAQTPPLRPAPDSPDLSD